MTGHENKKIHLSFYIELIDAFGVDVMYETNLIYLFPKNHLTRIKYITYQLMNVVGYLDLMPCLVKAE